MQNKSYKNARLSKINMYRFYLSESSYIDFKEEELNSFKDVEFTDDNTTKGKLVYLTRNDGKSYILIVPMDMLEEVLDD